MTVQASDKDITLFAKTNFRNREVPFGIRRDDRRRHMYIIGKTGMGKTTFIENMVVQDILNGHGICFVDPHGDSVEKILQFIPANRINDVIYLNPADVDWPIAFNPLEAVDPRHKHLVASGLMGVFTKIWAGVWSSRMEYILSNTILALLDSPGNTMLGIARMYVDKAYRKKIVDNIKDPVVKSFWVDEFANYQDKFRTEAIAPIQNKVGQFLSNSIIRNIVGQTKSSIDLRQIMDDRKILLLNLSKGRIGEDSSALLGAMIITKLQLAAMSRVDVPEEERADFYLYVDEFQNFATESFANILSEARKYRLNLIVAHQYIGQLVQDRNTIVRDAIFGNVGTTIAFRVGADDAEFLEKEFEPTYTMNDLVNLSKFSIYLKLMINGVASNPFSAETLPPISEPTGNTEKVIRVSRERYATDRVTVEQKISKWLGAEYHHAAADVESGSTEQEGAQEDMRFNHAPKVINKPAPAPKPIEAPKPVESVKNEQPKIEESAKDAASTIAAAPKLPQPKVIQKHPAPAPAKHKEPHIDHKSASKHADKHAKLEHKKPVKSQNPIWETVTKLATEKIQESAQRTNKALEALSKSLQESVKKDPLPIEKTKQEQLFENRPPVPSISVPKPPVKPESPVAPAPITPTQPETETMMVDAELPQDHINPENESLSPHVNIQDAIARQNESQQNLKPGEVVKFD